MGNSEFIGNPESMGNSKSLAILFGICLCCLTVSANGASSANSKNKKSDVRLLIDISGSMKKNDPNNLRIPALQLVTNLLPKGSDAGVWAFGRYVNMMVPLAQVDANWQRKATKTAKKINSLGLYTNIGSVLEKASYGWSKPDLREKRSFILLTDGMVDISKDASVNARERAKILDKILPKLKKAGVAIHTIALSQNADHDLLRQLSTQTDGWYQAVNDAAELQKVFLKIFEQAASRDNLPISDNQFTVDASIDEMTVLVFRQDATSAAKLVAPGGEIFSKDSATSKVRWFSTDGYDLITLQKPETGQWQIDAQVDPDNRVMVVSKLGLSIAELPNNLLAGEAINYELQLLEEGSVISNSDFLNLVDAKLEQNKGGQKSKLAMFFDGGSNTFKQNFYTDSFEGELKLQLHVTSPTFERVRSHAINIYGSPIETQVEVSEDNISPHKIIMSVRDDIVKPASLKVNVTISKPDGEKLYQGIEDLSKVLEIPANITGGEYSVEFKITGESVLGRQFSVNPEAIIFGAKSLIEETTVSEPTVDTKVVEEPAVEEPITNKQPEVEEIEPAEQRNEKKDSEINWLYVGILANLVLGIVGFFVWRIVKKRNTKGASNVANELAIDEDEEEDDE